jgi:hypothetical protein
MDGSPETGRHRTRRRITMQSFRLFFAPVNAKPQQTIVKTHESLGFSSPAALKKRLNGDERKKPGFKPRF